MNTKSKNPDVTPIVVSAEDRKVLTEEEVWERANWSKIKPMTSSWFGRFITALQTELVRLGREPKLGDRSMHGIKPRIKELHDMGLKADAAGRIMAYEYNMHSTLKREQADVASRLSKERDRAMAEVRELKGIEAIPQQLRAVNAEQGPRPGYTLKKLEKPKEEPAKQTDFQDVFGDADDDKDISGNR